MPQLGHLRLHSGIQFYGPSGLKSRQVHELGEQRQNGGGFNASSVPPGVAYGVSYGVMNGATRGVTPSVAYG